MKFFESTTVHYEIKNGKTTGTKEHVVVNGTKGTKTVEDIENKNNSVESESLSKNEIKKIMNRVFVPNLFSSLHLLNQSNLFRMNNNNTNNNKNNRRNNTRRRSASKNQTKKRRRH
jgi:hypothetical protein